MMPSTPYPGGAVPSHSALSDASTETEAFIKERTTLFEKGLI
jgi:hypothetical protein